MQSRTLDDLITALEVRLQAFAVCEIGADWRLRVNPLETVICHFVVRGHGYVEFANGRIPVRPGTIIIVPPGTPKSITGPDKVTQEITASESCDSYANGLLVFRARSAEASLVIGCATLSATCGGSVELFASLREPVSTSLSGNTLFASGFEALVQELTRPNIGAMVVAECLLKQALVLLLRDQRQGRDPRLLEHFGDERMLRAATAMIKSPAQAHCIESLAKICGMSRSSFIGQFVRNYGKPPGEFLQNVRMHSAARLLLTTEMPIKWVAAQVGYLSRSQFSRAFKLAFGDDPSAYRAAHLGSTRPPVLPMKRNEEVFITESLAMRPVRSEDLRSEKLALQELAERMVDDPVDLLPHFVRLAMQLTDSASAGLSIFDGRLAPDVFEWRCLHGLLAPFEKATTPRNNSPCGVTLDVNQPMLLSHPERIYDWVAAENMIIPEVLLVPLYVSAEPLGTLWVVSASEEHFCQADARVLSELASFVGIALKMQRGRRTGPPDADFGPQSLTGN